MQEKIREGSFRFMLSTGAFIRGENEENRIEIKEPGTGEINIIPSVTVFPDVGEIGKFTGADLNDAIVRAVSWATGKKIEVVECELGEQRGRGTARVLVEVGGEKRKGFAGRPISDCKLALISALFDAVNGNSKGEELI